MKLTGGKLRATAWGAGVGAVAAVVLGARAWAVRRLSRPGRTAADDRLELRVAERLAALPSTEGVDVLASAGRVVVAGQVPPERAATVIDAVTRVRGVRSVESLLRVAEVPAAVGSLVAVASVTVQAPASAVFAFWSRPERLAVALRHMREVVRENGDRYLFRAAAAGGPALSWAGEIVRYIPDALIAWKSVAGAPVGHSGIVRLGRAHGGTLLSVRLTYAAHDAETAHSLTTLMGAVPGHDLGADLRTWKDLFESEKLDVPPKAAIMTATADGAAPPRQIMLPPPPPAAHGHQHRQGGGGMGLGPAAFSRR